MPQENIIVEFLKAAGGTMPGPTRFHRMFYLLDQKGLGSGFDYFYHNSGPYSKDLEIALHYAKVNNLVSEEFNIREIDGASYSIFKLVNHEDTKVSEKINILEEFIIKLTEVDITVLELAAAAHWIISKEDMEDWEQEIRCRKKLKARSVRFEEVEQLLHQLRASV